jgi:hypothetical protein
MTLTLGWKNSHDLCREVFALLYAVHNRIRAEQFNIAWQIALRNVVATVNDQDV